MEGGTDPASGVGSAARGKAKAHDRKGIGKLFQHLRQMPMFAGIRIQVQHLQVETSKLGKVGELPVEMSELPSMRMLKLWQNGACKGFQGWGRLPAFQAANDSASVHC